jgi:anti-sigma factor RsiW
MSHPDELLAEYVDGTLPGSDRAVVDTHLSTCERCRAEVVLAGAARTALAALPEVPVPAGLATRALRESGVVRSGPPRWYRLAGAAAAAAVVALLISLVLPNIGGRPAQDEVLRAGAGPGSTAAEGAAGAELAASSSLEVQDANYRAADLESLTLPYAAQQDVGAAAEAAAPASRLGGPVKTTRALECLATAVPDAAGQLQRLIEARFQGSPAYFGFFLEGPGAGQPPDKVVIWVVAKEGCAILSFAQARI